jgi:Tol biopolymer transport system component
MKNDNIASGFIYKNYQAIKILVIFLVFAQSVGACHSYENQDGIVLIDSRGEPPAQSIVWSPTDASQVLVTSTDLNHHDNQVFILNTETLEKSVLKKTDNGVLTGLGWSPDNKRILLLSNSGIVGEKSKILSVSTNGVDEVAVTEGAVQAAWSPDESVVAFFSYGAEVGDNLREINLHLRTITTQKDETILTLKSQNSFGLSWSPDGKKLVFALGDLKSSNLFVGDIARQEFVQITKNGINDYPVWSPHGNLIAYHQYSEAGLVSTLSLIRSDGDCEIEIPNLVDAWSPTWLPDGKRLGFVGPDGIYVVDLEKLLGSDMLQGGCPRFNMP